MTFLRGIAGDFLSQSFGKQYTATNRHEQAAIGFLGTNPTDRASLIHMAEDSALLGLVFAVDDRKEASMRKLHPFLLSVTILLIVSLACVLPGAAAPTQDLNSMGTAVMETMISGATLTALAGFPVGLVIHRRLRQRLHRYLLHHPP